MAASASTRFLVLLKEFSAFRKISWTSGATNYHRQSRLLCHLAKEDGSLTLASLDLGKKPRKFGRSKATKLEGSYVTEMGQGKVRAVKNDKMKVVREKKPAEIVSPLFSAKSFEELGLPDSLLDSLEREGFSVPTDVQSAAVPTEVDELLSFNFREDIHRILEHVGQRSGAGPRGELDERANRQTILVSATVPFSVIRAAKSWSHEPVLVQANKVTPLDTVQPSAPVVSLTPTISEANGQDSDYYLFRRLRFWEKPAEEEKKPAEEEKKPVEEEIKPEEEKKPAEEEKKKPKEEIKPEEEKKSKEQKKPEEKIKPEMTAVFEEKPARALFRRLRFWDQGGGQNIKARIEVGFPPCANPDAVKARRFGGAAV